MEMTITSCKDFRYLLLIGLLMLASNSAAHPYDSPLEFREHKTEDGRRIYSNIPKACFSNGVLTCYRLHPIFPNTAAPAADIPARTE